MRLTYIYLFVLLATLSVGCKTAKNTEVKKHAIDGSPAKFKSESDKLKFDGLFFDGTKAKVLGNYDEAITKFLLCLKINDKVPDVYYQLYLCYINEGKKEALPMLDKAINLDPKNEWYVYEKADVLRRARLHQQSAQAYLELVEINPKKLEYYEEAAEQFIKAQKAEEAIKVLDKIEARFGINEDIIRQKEDLYLYLGKPQQAIAEVNKLVAALPNNFTYKGMLAELYAMTGQTEKAQQLFESILTAEPKNGKAHFGLASIYRQKRDSAKVIHHLIAGFEDQEVSLKEKINVILSIAPLGDTDTNYRKQVLQLAHTLAQTHKAEPQAHAIYADLLFGDGQFAAAAQQYEETVALDGNNFKVWQQLLSAYEQMGNSAKQAERSEAALELFPSRVIFYYYNAAAQYQMANYKKAAAMAQAGIDLGIGDNFVNIGLYTIAGDSYYKLQNYAETFNAFDEALAIDPQNAYVLNNYAYFLAQQNQRIEKALSMAKQALDKEPQNPAYMDTYGWVLYKSGKYAEAKTYIEKALSLVPNDNELLDHLGDIEFQLGNKEAALNNWKKSKENGNTSNQIDKKINEGKLLD